MITRTLTTFVAAAITLAATPVIASQPEAAVRVVHYGDLDLSTANGVKVLHHRIALALESVCGSYAAAMTDEVDAITRCRATALTKADQRVAAVTSKQMQVASAH